MREPIVAGNWKMNKTLPEGRQLVEELLEKLPDDSLQNKLVLLFPPYLNITETVRQVEGRQHVQVGAQNCHSEASGAFTGEVAADAIKSTGAQWVILGHSERRQLFGETDKMISQKVNRALDEGLNVILCCGETAEQREQKRHFEVVSRQLSEALTHVTTEQLNHFVVAYEPIWAIGTGNTASPADAQEMHHFIRQQLAQRFGEQVASSIRILYGGSVKPTNAEELFGQEDIDGGLVGGASLKADDFAAIVTATGK